LKRKYHKKFLLHWRWKLE